MTDLVKRLRTPFAKGNEPGVVRSEKATRAILNEAADEVSRLRMVLNDLVWLIENNPGAFCSDISDESRMEAAKFALENPA